MRSNHFPFAVRRLLSAAAASTALTAAVLGGCAAEQSPPSNTSSFAADQPSSSPLDTEILHVVDGTPTTIRTLISGDRAVLMWFWAPY